MYIVGIKIFFKFSSIQKWYIYNTKSFNNILTIKINKRNHRENLIKHLTIFPYL